MTPEQQKARDMAQVMLEFANLPKDELNRLESKHRADDPWHQICNPAWNWYEFYYRVRPNPAYRPWTPQEALGKQVVGLADGKSYQVIGVTLPLIVTLEDVQQRNVTKSTVGCLFENYKQPDGTHCGVAIESEETK